MQFSDLGKHCDESICKQLDFLPFTCEHCKGTFCKDHREVKNHSCNFDITQVGKMPQCPICKEYLKVSMEKGNADAIVNEHILQKCKTHLLLKRTISEEERVKQRRKCNVCKNLKNFDNVRCVKCQKLHCLEHRAPETHKCPSLKIASGPGKRTNVAASRLLAKIQASKATKTTTTTTTSKSKKKKKKKKKQSAAALKRKAIGDSNIKSEDSFFLIIEFPLTSITGKPMKQKPDQGMIFNRKWTIGRVVDNICKHNGLINRNNEAKAKKLHVFSSRTDAQFPHDISIQLLDPELRKDDRVRLAYVE